MGLYEERASKWPSWFREWQLEFYRSKEWQQLRKEVMKDRQMISDYSGTLITGKAVVDHIEEITPYNYDDEEITLNKDNLQLLSFEEHNTKTFSSYGLQDLDDWMPDRDTLW